MTVLSLSADALNLLASLAVGLVVGIERGWSQRQRSEGGRVAGLRTFALAGLLGGVLVLASGPSIAWALPGALIGLSLLLAVAWLETVRTSGDLSITTAVALLLTFLLGAAAMLGHVTLALAAAVVAAILLDLKSTLHRWLVLTEHRELAAALQMLVLSVVILPNLPDAGFGPYRAINPYELWWAVVLIAGLSLAGHIAMRATGCERGLFLTGALGGLASSTAATLALSRSARQQPALLNMTGAGALAACGVMYLRMFILLGAMAPALLKTFGVALVAAGAALILAGLWHWRGSLRQPRAEGQDSPIAPFDLATALAFGAFLGVMAVAVPAAKDSLGAHGVFTVAALSGLLDVDAIVISICRLYRAGALPEHMAIIALCLATLANMLAKVSIAWIVGGRAMGKLVLQGNCMALLAGALPLVPVVFQAVAAAF
jgi:uncharacterized membrane protein (DUF4010 family)